MNTINSFLFIDKRNEAMTSNSLFVGCLDTLSLEFWGDATSFNARVEGIVDSNNGDGIEFNEQWTSLAGIKLDDLTVSQNINTKGVYQFSISGFLKIRVVLSSISGGNITALGKAMA